MSPTAPFIAPERDQTLKAGRPKAGATEYFVLPDVSFRLTSTLALTSGTDYYAPFFVDTPIMVDRLACEVTTGAAGNLRMGIYRADADWQPIGAPLVDSGSIAITVAVKTFTPSPLLYLKRGRYLTVLNHDTGSTFREVISHNAALGMVSTIGSSAMQSLWRVTRAYAAFPTPGTAWTTTTAVSSGGLDYVVFLRVLTP